MSIHLREIREEDLELIMQWRMDPDITRYMNTDPKLTPEGQRKWFRAISEDTDVLYWLIEIEGQPAESSISPGSIGRREVWAGPTM